MVVAFLIVGACLFIFWLIAKPYIVAHDTICLYTGGNGSGKSFFSTKEALLLLRRLRLKRLWHNFLESCKLWKKSKDYWGKPLLFSTIPLRIGFKEWSCPLTVEHLMLQERLPLRCVVFIDEVNLLVSQMDYKLKGEKALNEFVTLFRHYTKGGYLCCNTQNLSKVHWIFRYCCNEAINLSEFKKPILGLPILAWAKVRKITLGDDIKAVEMDDAHESKSNIFGFFRLFPKPYDTYCFSDRYLSVPNIPNLEHYMQYKCMQFTKINGDIVYYAKTDGNH